MSEFNPFSANDEAQEFAAEVAAEGSGSRRNRIALGALAAVTLGAGAFLLLGGGGEEDFDEFLPAARAPGAAAPAAVAPAAAVKLPSQSAVSLGRNPFRALYIQPQAAAEAPPAAAPQAPGTDVTSPGDSATTGGTPGTDGATPGGGTSTGGTGTVTPPQQPTAKEHKLILLRVFGEGADQSASFSIDGKEQTAKVGSTFGPHAEILLISLQQGPKDDQWTAVLQVGDGDPFDVVTGEPVFVR